MRHSILIGALIIVLSSVAAAPARAFDATPCHGLKSVALDGLSWITPLPQEASARVSLLLPGPGVLTVEAVAGERAEAVAWVDVLACRGARGQGLHAPHPIPIRSAFGRRSVRVARGGVVVVEVATLGLGSMPAGRLTLATRFVPEKGSGAAGKMAAGDGSGTEESNNEVLPGMVAPPMFGPHAGMGKMAADDGSGTEESNNEVLPGMAPPQDPSLLGLGMAQQVLGQLAPGRGPLHADQPLAVTIAGTLTIRVAADGPLRLDLITERGFRLASIPSRGQGDRHLIQMSPHLPAGRYYLRVVGEAGRSLRYGIRIDAGP